GQHIVVLVILDGQLAVDPKPSYPGRILVWLVERRRVAVGLRIESDNVGIVARLEVTTVGKTQNVSRQSTCAADRQVARQVLLSDRKAADLAGKTTVAARVRYGRARNHRTTVARGGHKRLPHDQPHVVLAHAEMDNLCSAIPLNFHDDVQWH